MQSARPVGLAVQDAGFSPRAVIGSNPIQGIVQERRFLDGLAE
jgi:hypothetical protein